MVRRMHRFALCALVLALGCVDENPSLFISGVLLPDQEGGSCVYSCAGPSSATLQPSGADDPLVDAGSGYVAGVCVANLRVNNASAAGASGFAADTGRVLFRRSNIQLFGINGEDLNLEYSVPLANSVPSAPDPTTPASQAVIINLIPPSVGEFLGLTIGEIEAQTGSATILVTFTVEGETTGGIDVESSPSTFAVTVVNAGLACQAMALSDDFVPPCFAGVDRPAPFLSGSTEVADLEGVRGEPLPICFGSI